MLFNHNIGNLSDWSKVFQDKKIFEPIVEYIFKKHNIPYKGIDNCTPGSNAVFRVGAYIVKIFAPEESEIGSESDFITEAFGIKRASTLNISTPKLIASGVINDKYVFRYLVLEYIEAESLTNISGTLSREERVKVGHDLRIIVDKMDTLCEKFNSHVLFDKAAENRWTVFPLEFLRQRKDYLKAYANTEDVYVHGDLNPDNILVNSEKEIYIIDFADALLAPIELELAAIVCDGFHFDLDYIHGFFGEYNKDQLLEQLIYGLLIHDFGVNIIRDNIGNPIDIHSIEKLRSIIREKL